MYYNEKHIYYCIIPNTSDELNIFVECIVYFIDHIQTINKPYLSSGIHHASFVACTLFRVSSKYRGIAE